MASKRYVMADGKTWTENYDEAGLWPVAVAAKVLLSWDQVACLIPDASGLWLVVNYEDPDLEDR